MRKIKKFSFRLISVALFFVPFVLIILPIDFFDTGKSMCLSKIFLQIECLGCGITRGIQHLIHFDFKGSWEYNKLSFIVLPVLIFLWIKNLREIILLFKKS